jgi:hypothetical protein
VEVGFWGGKLEDAFVPIGVNVPQFTQIRVAAQMPRELYGLKRLKSDALEENE